MEFFLAVMGMVMIIEGLPWFAFPQKMKSYLEQMLKVPEGTLRGLGLFLMAAGMLLLHLGKR